MKSGKAIAANEREYTQMKNGLCAGPTRVDFAFIRNDSIPWKFGG